MSLQKKTLLISGLVYGFLILTVYILGRLVLLNQYLKLEERMARQDVEGVLNMIAQEQVNMNRTANDWASWDETYFFVEDLNEAYIRSNLMDATFLGLNLNLMVFINSSGQVVFNKAFDLQKKAEIILGDSLDLFLKDRVFLSATQSSITGTLMLPEGPLLIASQPILTSEGKGPAHGSLIVGRFLDAAAIERISEVTRLSTTLLPLDSAALPQGVRSLITSDPGKTEIFIQPVNREYTAGYTILWDIFNKPIYVLMVQEPRSIYREGQTSITFLVSALLIIGLALGFLNLLLLKRLVLDRVTFLSRNVTRIGVSGDKSVELQLTGKDEISTLAQSINLMLQALDNSEKALKQSEEHYRTTVESLTDLVCRWLPDGRLTFVNEACCRFFGKPREELIGQKLYSLISEEDLEKVKAHTAALTLENPQGTLEYRLIDSDGKTRWQQWVNRFVYDEVKDLTEILSIGREITERKQVEEALRKSEAELRALFLAMNDVVIVYDREGHYLRVAPTNASLLYKPADEMIGKTLHEVLPAQQANLLLEHIHKSLDTKETVSLDYSLNINGRDVWFSGAISPLLEDTVILVAHDITNRKLMEEIVERQARELAALYLTSLEINVQKDLTSLLRAIIERATSLLDANAGALYLVLPDGKSLGMVASHNLPDNYLGVILQLGEGISGRVARLGKPLMVEDYLTWPGRVKPFADSPFRRVLGVPLKVKNQVIGVINVTDDQKTGPFSDGDVELLGLFADQAAIAVENARLFAEVQRLSNTDELTGLYNRRQFFELAGCEFERACRYRHPLSAIMIDTDHFKQVNDTYGHAVGDQVLKDMGTRFRENLRKIDIIGRYGGDEFSILLPEDDLDSAHHAAERLRRCIADSPVDTNQGPLAVTVSVGVAAFSQDCLSLKSLLDRADIAMYVAKENGNNRVEIYRSD